MSKLAEMKMAGETMAHIPDLFSHIDLPPDPAPAKATIDHVIPPGVVRDLVEAELARPAPRGGYFRGLATVEPDETIKATLMQLAAEHR